MPSPNWDRRPTFEGLMQDAGFAISSRPCYGKPMFARRTIGISGPASA
jgi:hypothetical protein